MTKTLFKTQYIVINTYLHKTKQCHSINWAYNVSCIIYLTERLLDPYKFANRAPFGNIITIRTTLKFYDIPALKN